LPTPSPLPVNLVSFSASFELVSKQVRLDWVTASEKNNDYFTIERSRDQLEFEPVTNVKGKSTTQVKQLYTTYDTSPLTGTSYYRLKQTDFNGKSSYSKIVATNSELTGFTVYPNPLYGREITIHLNNRAPRVMVTIYSALGRVVSFNQQVSENRTQLKIYLNETLEKGIYFIRVHTDSGSLSQKLAILEN
jgi:hypothetical protein